jgi:hypothetical protein
MTFDDPMQGISKSCQVMILNFAEIPDDLLPEQNIKQFFDECHRNGKNPRLPENRQAFNNAMLAATGSRYLMSRYLEDRSAMLEDTPIYREGRTLHLGVDIFAKDCEQVFAPSDGQIITTGYEPGFGEYGHYLIFQPDDLPDTWFFFGHLAKDLPPKGRVTRGAKIARLGDYPDNENGAWSRHLHLQIIRAYDPQNPIPPGYAAKSTRHQAKKRYPNPLSYFPQWHDVTENQKY